MYKYNNFNSEKKVGIKLFTIRFGMIIIGQLKAINVEVVSKNKSNSKTYHSIKVLFIYTFIKKIKTIKITTCFDYK